MREETEALLSSARQSGLFKLVTPRYRDELSDEQVPALMISRRRKADSEAEDDACKSYKEGRRYEVSIAVDDPSGEDPDSVEATLRPYDDAERLASGFLTELLAGAGYWQKRGEVVEPFSLGGRHVLIHTIVLECTGWTSYEAE